MRKFLVLFLTILLVSCQEKTDIQPNNVDIEFKNGILIVNEGTFGWGNSTLSYFDFETKTIKNKIFHSINKRPIGDIAYFAKIIDNKIFVVVNNSSKIEVLDIKNLKSIATITGFNSPRQICKINENKAYVSDLYAKKIYIVDLHSFIIKKTINTKEWTEGMNCYNDKIFVSCIKDQSVLVIDTQNDSIRGRINLSKGEQSMKKDKNENLWVLCDGFLYPDKDKAVLYKIDLDKEKILSKMIFSNIKDRPAKLSLNKTKDTLFFINNGVYRISINDSMLPNNQFINSNNSNFYAIEVDSEKNRIYLSDALDYVQKGYFFIHNLSSGKRIDSFKVGISPSFFMINR